MIQIPRKMIMSRKPSKVDERGVRVRTTARRSHEERPGRPARMASPRLSDPEDLNGRSEDRTLEQRDRK